MTERSESRRYGYITGKKLGEKKEGTKVPANANRGKGTRTGGKGEKDLNHERREGKAKKREGGGGGKKKGGN